jgi:RHS repeat-associated protein
VIERYTYDVFGSPTILSTNNTQLSTSAYGNRFMFQGREYFPELGIYDYRHRMYHPGLGRFLQTDPTGFDAGDMNLFRYCSDDPVSKSDPMGLYYEINPTGPGAYTITVPIKYEGTAATKDVIARFNKGITGLSGDHHGTHLTFEVTTPNPGQRTNTVYVNKGYGENKGFGSERGSDKGWWYAEGGSKWGKHYSPEDGARHSVWHFFRFRDRYDPQTGQINAGVDPGNIMTNNPGGRPSSDDVQRLINPGRWGKFLLEYGFLGGPGSVGGAPSDVRWAEGVAGNWTADQFSKYTSDLAPNAGEGFHRAGPR